jgi:hypothetical protein
VTTLDTTRNESRPGSNEWLAVQQLMHHSEDVALSNIGRTLRLPAVRDSQHILILTVHAIGEERPGDDIPQVAMMTQSIADLVEE